MSLDNKKYLKVLADYEAHSNWVAQSTALSKQEAPDAKLKRIKALEADYIAWFEYYFPNYAKKKSAWFHKKLADIIVSNKRLRLLAEMFRSAGKSVHIDMGIPLYLYLALKDLRFMLLIGETEKKAKQLLSGIQSQLEHNQRIKNDYGEKFQHGDWAEGDFTTTDGVKFMSLGFNQNPRGAREQAERPDYIVVDDVDSKKHVNNDRLMRESLDYITEDVWGCFDSDEDGTERFVYANNNFHKNSITNRLRLYFKTVIDGYEDEDTEDDEDIELDEPDDTVFEILKVCAVKDLIDFEPEWPEKASSKFWEKRFKRMPYRSFMREYMHVHIEDGSIFKYEDILYCAPLPLDQYDALCFYGDLSYKDKGDYKGLGLVGKKGRDYHIIYVYLRQKSRADVARWLYDTYEKYNLKAFKKIKYWIEGLFAMDDFVNDFDIEGDKRGYHIPVVPDKSPKGDKHDRIEGTSGYFERHNVYFNESKTKDINVLVDQYLAFEKGSAAKKDGPDFVQGAMEKLNIRTRKKKAKWVAGKRKSRKF